MGENMTFSHDKSGIYKFHPQHVFSHLKPKNNSEDIVIDLRAKKSAFSSCTKY